MSFRVVTKNSVTVSASPYRLLYREREVTWANDFLDAQRLRQLSLRSLRAYAFDLLHAARWFQTKRHSLARLNQSLLLQYVHDQLQHPPQPTAQTVNHRLAVLRCLYRFHYGREIPGKTSFRAVTFLIRLSATATVAPGRGSLLPCACGSRAG